MLLKRLGSIGLTRLSASAYILATESNTMYTMGEHNIEETVEERDLGVLVTETLSPSHHIAKIVRKANQIVGMIRRTYEDRSKNNLVPLYKSLVRPHLEYCVQTVEAVPATKHKQHRRSTAKDDQDDERSGRGRV